MTALDIWLTALGGLAIFLASALIPLWISLRYPERVPDNSQAREYLRAEAAGAEPAGIASHVVHGPHDYAVAA